MSDITLFSIPNLAATQVKPVRPWEVDAKGAPEGMTKKQFAEWVNNPATMATFVSGFAGLNPHTRINAKENPPYEMHALIADYDAPLSQEEIDEGLAKRVKAGYVPSYYHRTVSGNLRVIWLFEKPLRLVASVTENFLKQLRKEIGVDKLFPGVDEAILRPNMFYQWNPPAVKVSDARIPETTLFYLISRAVDATRHYKGEGPNEVPLEKVYEEMTERGWAMRWPGQFTANARGPAFWDPDSTNPTSAIVTATGMIAFSQPKPFYSWGDIFGPAFIRQFEEDKYGAPLAAFHYDGQGYWRKQEGIWRVTNKENARQDLQEFYGLSGSPDGRGQLSEADSALTRIRATKLVDKAFPVLYCPKDIVRIGNETVLNVCRLHPVYPHDKPVVWGEGFPWLAKFLEFFFENTKSGTGIDPFPAFISWLSRFYKSAIAGVLVQGHALFIAGKAGRGKTLLSNVIIGQLMGGQADASDFLLGEASWNKELLETPMWVVDDAKAMTSNDRKSMWSAMIKKSVANTRHPYNVKYRDTATVEWKGRIMVSLNDDPSSMQQIPHTDINILDKIMLFRSTDEIPDFPANEVVEATVRSELPYFARYLKDYEIPESIRGGNRFGVRSYHHPVILEDSRSMDRSAALSDLIEAFIDSYRTTNPGKAEWSGNSTQFLQAVNNVESLKDIARAYTNSPDQMGRKLASLAATSKVVRRNGTRHGSAIWSIAIPPSSTNNEA